MAGKQGDGAQLSAQVLGQFPSHGAGHLVEDKEAGPWSSLTQVFGLRYLLKAMADFLMKNIEAIVQLHKTRIITFLQAQSQFFQQKQ